MIATALVNPDADIALGYEGTELQTTDGLTIQGLLIKQGDPLMIRSMGNVTQLIPAKRVAEAAAHERVVDDERVTARAHRPGGRRSCRVSARQLRPRWGPEPPGFSAPRRLRYNC